MAEHNIQQLNRFKIERENTIQFPLRNIKTVFMQKTNDLWQSIISNNSIDSK